MANRLVGFPKATEASPVIYHSGLAAEELQAAADLGYRCEDVRFIPGIAGIKATLLGLRMGTVTMSAPQVSALRAEAEVWEKVPDDLETQQSKGAQDVDDMLERQRGNDTYEKLWKTEAPKAKGVPTAEGGGFYTGIKRKPGRPRKNPAPESN